MTEIPNDIAVLMSGGVDSSVALLRLLSHTPQPSLKAYYLKIWLEDELDYLGTCPWEEDLNIVKEVCALAKVPLEVVSLQQEYQERIISYTLEELRAGRTPSPDVLCNTRIKFGAFYEFAGNHHMGIASGHYAGVYRTEDGIYHLRQGRDPVKDQSYFLSHLRQDQLSRLVLPLDGLTKPEVRALAESFKLPNRTRPDSQGLCFLGKISFRDFIRHHLGTKQGKIVDRATGKFLGYHDGYWFHTIGQRKGLNLAGGPWYVASKDVDSNTVYVDHQDRNLNTVEDRFLIPSPHWLSGEPTTTELRVKIRHGANSYGCSISKRADDGTLEVRMDNKDKGIAAGQFAALYHDGTCLGGGIMALWTE